MSKGMVYLVGAGPGAWGLMTLRGMELLKGCDAVVYDHLSSAEFLSLTSPRCRTYYVGKRAGHHSMKQEEINRLLVSLAKEGLNVVRLKGGDPFVFGRGGEEILVLKEEGIPWEVVPGVTSAIAVPELAGIPVTHRAVSRSFHVITGHIMSQNKKTAETPDIRGYARLEGTLVFLMGAGSLKTIASELIEGGKSPDTPSAIIENGSLPQQRIVRAPLCLLEQRAREEGIGTPAVIVVGDTASLSLCCEQQKPLSGVNIAVTGTSSFTSRLKTALEAEGAKTSCVLSLELETEEGFKKMEPVYERLSSYTWIVFTSANGVSLFMKGLFEKGLDIRALAHQKIAVIGKGTKDALMEFGIRADYMPEEYDSLHLAKGLGALLFPSDCVLLARSRDGSSDVPQMLREKNIAFDDIPLYFVKGTARGDSSFSHADYLIFASASGVRAFFDASVPVLSDKTRIACIGHITEQELEKCGKKAEVVSEKSHIPGLVAALKRDWEQLSR